MVQLCVTCRSYLGPSPQCSDDTSTLGDDCCIVCLGVFSHPSRFRASLKHAIEGSSHVYGSRNNRFSIETSAVSIPGDILCRYQSQVTVQTTTSAKEYSDYIKQHVRGVLSEVLRSLQNESNDNNDDNNDDWPPCVSSGEQGYLSVYVVIVPTVSRPTDLETTDRPRKKRRLNRHPESQQHGDPRTNLEKRLTNKGIKLWSLNQVISKGIIPAWGGGDEPMPLACALDFHAAVWRRPFYLSGFYTKHRRDVSQSPFFINKKERLGVTSVEEQITTAIVSHCGGISSSNHDPPTVFGKCKFHASGREDIDVRMLLPDDPGLFGNSCMITGRPFVCEVVDSIQMPHPSVLKRIVNAINFPTSQSPMNLGVDDFGNEPTKLLKGSLAPSRYYGQNPWGVGIDPDHFEFAPASSFSRLQSETEEKVKYYGCLCWCRDPIPSQKELDEKFARVVFPMTLDQATPLRVLHRRSNLIRSRQVLTCRAHWVDEHYFRLKLSTQAGTYVKEFVHSDLGRTRPSVASIVQCPCDIFELDCEGLHKG